MKYRVTFLTLLFLGIATLLSAHDLFLRMDSYFLPGRTAVTVPVLNGTFSSSEASVAPDRLIDLSLVTPDGRRRLPTDVWSIRNDSSFISVRTGRPGTYVMGVSTRFRVLALPADAFNSYLEHEGLGDVLAARRQRGEMERDVAEQYAKHIKAVFQVGDERTDGFSTALGYPAEIIPMVNPYALGSGDTLAVRCVVDGQPVADQVVILGGEDQDGPLVERSARTDRNGIARFVVARTAQWYVKFIHMERAPSNLDDFDYASKWATLTFETR